jgi:hypothetical protein
MLALVLAAALLLLNACLYSPWHQHDRLANGGCALCQFGHLSSPEPSPQIQLPPPALHDWLYGDQQPILFCGAAFDHEYSRAPPA